ncbi:hypothetical protein FE257_002658 [Aspergillus nanangensis]|uniref:Major facilitator superfamily (MFS) profile domain-containing protein n=1 Tax=Aspergillus nanangensis TaxID=2582783 RepID=A0AAD4GNZ5_ASPNN|nr:hypothetical protein FE257_002658 [Aspergillus nanangensis]
MPTVLVDRAGVSPDDKVFWTSIILTSETGAAFFACPILGYVVDLSHRRQLPFLAGVVVIAASMAIFTAARSTTLYVIGRVLQGVASAMVDVAGLALLKDRIGRDGLGEALGYFGTASMVGLMASPPLGGLLYQEKGYYAVCGLGFAIVAVDFGLRLAVAEPKGTAEGNPAEEVAPTTPDVQAKPESSVSVGENQATSGYRNKHGVLTLLKQRRVLVTLWALFVDGLTIGAFDAIIPTFVAGTFRWGPFAAGLIFLAMAAPALLEPLFGRLCDRFGVRIMTVLGYSMYAPSLVCLQFVRDNTLAHKVLLGVLLALCGLSGDLGQPALYLETQLVLDELEEETPGIFGQKGAVAQGFGLQTMANYAGLAVGPIVGQHLFDSFGWEVTMWTLGAIAGVTALPMFFLSNEGIMQEEEARSD